MSISLSRPWQIAKHGVIVRVHLQPRATQNRLVGLHGHSLKITLTSPPVKNAANTSLLSFLAALLHLPRSTVSLLDGAKSREKRVLITTPMPEVLVKTLEQLLARVDKKSADG